MNKMNVYEIKDESVKKIFSNKYAKREDISMRHNETNLDKRIHKILDSIKTKTDNSKLLLKDNNEVYRTNPNDHNNMNKSIEKENSYSNDNVTIDRSTNDTLNYQRSENSLYHSKENTIKNSLKYSPQTQQMSHSKIPRLVNYHPNIKQPESDDRKQNDCKNIMDKIKNKRNIINCANKEELKESDRPYSAPIKKIYYNTDRGGKEKSD